MKDALIEAIARNFFWLTLPPALLLFLALNGRSDR